MKYIVTLVLLAALALGLFFAWPRPQAAVGSSLLEVSAAVNTPLPSSGFTRADGPRPLSFPADFGPHPGFQTEWWYYTGNLQTSDGRQFGYQLTFFRRALLPKDANSARSSDFAALQVYMAHFTLTDVSAGQFHVDERFERGAAGLAGAQAQPDYRVWLHDWSVTSTAKLQGSAGDGYQLRAENGGVSIDLQLTDLTGPVLQGEQGYSRKGADPSNASYYYSQPRLQTSGQVVINGTSYAVSGLSWMDHEFSTSALQSDEVGWDWFALRLSDGSELMVYDFRLTGGGISAYSNGTLIHPDGSTQTLSHADFQIEVLSTWKSPHSGATYPASWRVTLPSQAIDLTVTPLLADQELNVSYSYWEGAVQISGQKDGQTVSGRGYVELTGYAKPMNGL